MFVVNPVKVPRTLANKNNKQNTVGYLIFWLSLETQLYSEDKMKIITFFCK